MKPTAIKVIVSGLVIAVSFFAGRGFQHTRNGYQRTETERMDIKHPLGRLVLLHTNESVGFPFMNTGTTELQFESRLIYKAQRDFQESAPVARDVIVADRTVKWSDGDFVYSLTIEKEEPEKPLE